MNGFFFLLAKMQSEQYWCGLGYCQLSLWDLRGNNGWLRNEVTLGLTCCLRGNWIAGC